jgi:uncharacterized membrane protein
MTTDEKLDIALSEIAELRRLVQPLAELVAETSELAEKKSINRGTISANDNLEKFVVAGKKKVLVSLKSVEVLRHHKNRRKQAR